MKVSHIMMMTLIAAVLALGLQISTANAATTFVGSTVEAVDLSKQTLSFKTREGMAWTLPVKDPELLKKEPLAKGEQISLEVDTNDNVTKITKLSAIGASPDQAPDQDAIPRN